MNVVYAASLIAAISDELGGCNLAHHRHLLSLLSVSVGYEYESCLDVVLWEKRTAVLQGYELDAANMGGWMLDKHHILDIQNGKNCIYIQNMFVIVVQK